eukprot:TRINITY_DN881_c1_g1_i1.p1 TRINITY_DN881_c1_g1~~TRINITY_DN881_c1_g1_i1.p1  ORF type:complete len:467 (-),score=152.85 TRINITY_DN881_c1_g1_i1:929-2227(-)
MASTVPHSPADPDKKKVHRKEHIVLTTHPYQMGVKPVQLKWGSLDPAVRGPVIATLTDPGKRNAIGAHSGSYGFYRALSVAIGAMDPERRPDYTNTAPAEPVGPYASWADPDKIVSLDPFGHVVTQVFAEHYRNGYDIRPTIAITKAHINFPEMQDAIRSGRVTVDGQFLKASGEMLVTKAAIDHVWHLPGIARRFNIDEGELRRVLFQQTGGMYPELITRPDLDVFLPPIGGTTVYIVGNPRDLADPSKLLACRVHDECNGSDVFGSDICTCRPYLTHGAEECVKAAQQGGVGLLVYNRKEGRALGEVTKFLVYNARKRQEGGDRADKYFVRTECVAGVQDMRFQQLMPDVLHWLGVTKIDKLVSMSDMKYDAIVSSGIEVRERIPIPPELIPADAHVEIDAKIFAGYYTPGAKPQTKEDLQKTVGRGLDE